MTKMIRYLSVAMLLLVPCLPAESAAQQCPDLGPLDDGTGQSIGLVLSEISPGSFIELFNETDADIDLAATPYQLCSPFNYESLAVLSVGDSVVPARGYLTLPWPIAFNDADAGGEIILYSSTLFNSASAIVDFVCWGLNPHASRKVLAEGVAKWSGDCAPALSASSLSRLADTQGTVSADYDTAGSPSPLACSAATPVPSSSRWMLLLLIYGLLIVAALHLTRSRASVTHSH